MAVRERSKGGKGYYCFSSRMPQDTYKDLNEWAWENRLTLRAACSELLEKALKTERGGEYTRRSDMVKTAAK